MTCVLFWRLDTLRPRNEFACCDGGSERVADYTRDDEAYGGRRAETTLDSAGQAPERTPKKAGLRHENSSSLRFAGELLALGALGMPPAGWTAVHHCRGPEGSNAVALESLGNVSVEP